MKNRVTFLDKDITEKKFQSCFKAGYSVQWTNKNIKNLLLLDSFDGRLMRAGIIMVFSDKNVSINHFKQAKAVVNIPWSSEKAPVCARDFKEIDQKKYLGKILLERALIPQLSVEVSLHTFNVLNNDKKTVGRGQFIKTFDLNNPGKTITAFKLNSLRGYSSEVQELRNNIPGAELPAKDFEASLYTKFDVQLKDLSRANLNFSPTDSMAQALKDILSENYKIVCLNEQGIIDDTDIEFLHDYRVACRRMRSALSLVKKIIDGETQQQLVTDLKWLGKFSGPLRDLDVYLLREDEYKALTPKSFSISEVHSIFVNIKKRRRIALKNMINMLQSAEYAELKKRWSVFFRDYPKHILNNQPVYELAKLLIYKRFTRVMKDGAKLTKQTPDDKFHDLRIECKKLRYLLGFFSSLFPEKQIQLAIKHLKKIQDNLGEFNDLSVQIDSLGRFLNNRRNPSLEFVQTTAGLIAILNYKMHLLRDNFYALFNEFQSDENISLYTNLFGNAK
jgi:CHAD domain-containing protein